MSRAPYAGWPAGRVREMTRDALNGAVGSKLVSETETCRVWHLTLAPGERTPFHRHVLDYFWTAVTPGRSRSHYEGGEIRDTVYAAGDAKHYRFRAGEHMLHDLENIGDTVLTFVTVEFKGGANAPLSLPHDARLS